MPEETKAERVNRELIELLNELRVALPGVQVLLGFLLILPFSNGWRTITDVLYESPLAGVVAALFGAGVIAFWFVVPLAYTDDDDS